MAGAATAKHPQINALRANLDKDIHRDKDIHLWKFTALYTIQ
jgi:hypothetical protein